MIAPGQASFLEESPASIAPLQSARGFLGEIKVWREVASLTQAEERLLQTFASQGVLALERVRLSQAASRARLLEESDRFKSSLLSSVSHELRTPLATIKAAVTSLRSGTVEWDTEARHRLNGSRGRGNRSLEPAGGEFTQYVAHRSRCIKTGTELEFTG